MEADVGTGTWFKLRNDSAMSTQIMNVLNHWNGGIPISISTYLGYGDACPAIMYNYVWTSTTFVITTTTTTTIETCWTSCLILASPILEVVAIQGIDRPINGRANDSIGVVNKLFFFFALYVQVWEIFLYSNGFVSY